MNLFAEITLLGWIPVVLMIFMALPARRAVIVAFIAAWLFLPVGGFTMQGAPDFTKMSATCMGALLAAAMFDSNRVISFRPSWIDLPMLIWCLCPIASSLTNDLGLYDGLATAKSQTLAWGLPYFLGRLYFSDREGLRELAMGVLIGGLVYVPLCLYEIRMSPQLHRMIYGFFPHDWAQTKRWGGWRPQVFMQHGLAVGSWMAAASLVGIWLWANGTIRRMWGMPIAGLVAVLLGTTILCKSTGALVLLAVGLAVLFVSRWLRTSVLIWMLIIAAPMYVFARSSGLWSATNLVELIASIDADRATSVQFRIQNEDAVVTKALQRPVFGWGGWARSHVRNESGRDITTMDGLWIIAFGNYGAVGLASLMAALLLPAAALVWRWPVRYWSMPGMAPVGALTCLMILYTIDSIPNAMINPIFVLIGGGLLGFAHLPGLPAAEYFRARKRAAAARMAAAQLGLGAPWAER